MKSQYFREILPTRPFTPAPKATIRNIPVQEQWDGLMQLLKDADANELRDDYLFYVFWTGFLYALSRSDILAILRNIKSGSINPHANPLESFLMAAIIGYFFKYLWVYLNQVKTGPDDLELPSWLKDIIKKLLERGYMHSNKKTKLIAEVLSDMLKSGKREIGEVKDLLTLVLKMLENSISLSTILGSAKY